LAWTSGCVLFCADEPHWHFTIRGPLINPLIREELLGAVIVAQVHNDQLLPLLPEDIADEIVSPAVRMHAHGQLPALSRIVSTSDCWFRMG
jgi:hypothetical protein